MGQTLIAGSVLLVSLAVFFRVPFLPSIGTEVGMSDAQLAATTSAFAIGRLIIDLPAGRLADRFHPYGLMAVGVVVAALGSFTLGGALDPTLVYVGALLLGVSSGVSNTSGLHFFSTISAAGRRASSVSIYSSVLLVGQASGPPVAAVLASFGTWRSAHALAGIGLALLAIVLVVALIGSGGMMMSTRSAHAGQPDPPAGGTAMARWVLYLVPFVMFGTFGVTVHTLVPIIGDDLGIDLASIALALAIGGGFRFIAIVSGGQVADRVARKAALVPAIAVSAGGVGLLSVASTYSSWLLAIIAVSMGSIAISVSATVIGDISPVGRTGRALARWRFTGDLGMVSVPFVAGVAFERAGTLWALAPLAAALLLLAVAAWLFVPETSRSWRSAGRWSPRSR